MAMIALLFPVVAFAQSTATIVEMQRLLTSLKAQLASLQQQRAAQSNAEAISVTITRPLTLGAKGPDVTALQQFLKYKGHFNGYPTGYFGPLTRQAVAAFQSANGLEPVGHVGPQTRRLLIGTVASAAQASASVPASGGQMFVRALDLGSRGDDVTALQHFLKSKRYINFEPTGYYGSLTHEAVKQFQQANDVEAVGTVGPKTRALLNSLSDTLLKNTAAVSTNTSRVSGAPQGASNVGGGGGSSPAVGNTHASSDNGGTTAVAPAVTPSSISSNNNGIPAVTPADVTPPSTPANLAATAISSSRIDLTWTASTDNVGVTGYKIFRDAVQIGTSTNASYSDVSLTASTVYNYTVAGFDASGNMSAQSSASVAITRDVAPAAIATGSRVIATANLSVRSDAGINKASVGNQPVGAKGTVIAGPMSADGYTWWKINYDTEVDGWSIADYLVALTPASSPAVGTSGHSLLIASAQ